MSKELGLELRSFRQERASARKALLPTLPGSGVGFFDRAKMSFGSTLQEKMDILRQQGLNPIQGAGGELLVEKDGRRQRVDPDTFELSDLADFAGEVPSAFMSALGGTAGAAAGAGVASLAGAAGGAAAGGMLGNTVKQNMARSFGAKGDFDFGELGTEGALSVAGEGVGRLAGRALSPLADSVTKRLGKNVGQPAQELGQKFGQDLSGSLPVSARTESKLANSLEQGVSRTPRGGELLDERVVGPFNQKANDVFSEIGRRASGGVSQRGASAATVGEAVTGARKGAIESQRATVDKAYDALAEVIAPNQPVIPTQTLTRLSELVERKAPLAQFKTVTGRLKTVQDLLDDADQITSFGQLDAFRREIGGMIGGNSELIGRHGLEAEFSGVYRALRQDVDEFLGKGGRLFGDELDTAINRQRNIATQAAEAAAGPGEKMSLSKAIDLIGGLNPKGLEGNEIPGRVMGRIRRVFNKHGGNGQNFDLVASRLDEQFPELGIDSPRGLVDALRREDRFFQEVDAFADEGAGLGLQQPLETFGEQSDDILRRLPGARSASEVTDLANQGRQLGAKGSISPFEQERVINAADQEFIRTQGGAPLDVQGPIEAAGRAMDTRAAGLHREIPELAGRAKNLAKDQFKIDDSATVKSAFKDPDTIENLVSGLMSKNRTGAQIRRLKESIGAVDTPGGLQATAEGQAAWQDIQGQVLDLLEQSARTGRVADGVPIMSGKRMVADLNRMGPEALDEMFGRESAADLMKFATFLRDSNVAERAFGVMADPNGGQLGGLLRQVFPSVIGLGAQVGARLGATRAVTKPLGQRMLTEGFGANNDLFRTLGRVGGQTGVRELNEAFRR